MARRKRSYSIEFHLTVCTPDAVETFTWESDAVVPNFRAMLNERFNYMWTDAWYTYIRKVDGEKCEGRLYNPAKSGGSK